MKSVLPFFVLDYGLEFSINLSLTLSYNQNQSQSELSGWQNSETTHNR